MGFSDFHQMYIVISLYPLALLAANNLLSVTEYSVVLLSLQPRNSQWNSYIMVVQCTGYLKFCKSRQFDLRWNPLRAEDPSFKILH